MEAQLTNLHCKVFVKIYFVIIIVLRTAFWIIIKMRHKHLILVIEESTAVRYNFLTKYTNTQSDMTNTDKQNHECHWNIKYGFKQERSHFVVVYCYILFKHNDTLLLQYTYYSISVFLASDQRVKSRHNP